MILYIMCKYTKNLVSLSLSMWIFSSRPHIGAIYSLLARNNEPRVAELRKIIYFCRAMGIMLVGLHIFDESVLAFILEWKSGKFQSNKESNTLVTSYC